MLNATDTGPWPPAAPLYRYSKLILPKNMSEASVPAVIMIHGGAPSPMIAKVLRWSFFPVLYFLGWARRNTQFDWSYMMPLGEKVAQDGFAVLLS